MRYCCCGKDIHTHITIKTTTEAIARKVRGSVSQAKDCKKVISKLKEKFECLAPSIPPTAITKLILMVLEVGADELVKVWSSLHPRQRPEISRTLKHRVSYTGYIVTREVIL